MNIRTEFLNQAAMRPLPEHAQVALESLHTPTVCRQLLDARIARLWATVGRPTHDLRVIRS